MCSSSELSARGFPQDNSGCPSGMLTLTHPVQLFFPEKIMQETLHDHHISIFINGRSIHNLRYDLPTMSILWAAAGVNFTTPPTDV